ncbi:O-antigen ligase family protein [Pseudomonas sp. LFM046]|uniref:PglL family O-oligosaccharyltransferase n=1 Tax=Pseudomonas sp. LFM046 TaxID=1608357 RepID=UPI0005CFC65E|nr:O-antigen ligase family protein [Pseudomonas sp. LFM046]
MILPLFLLSLSFLIPNHYLPWMSFYSEYLAFGFLVSAWLWLMGQRLKVGISGILMILLGAVPFIQWKLDIVYFSGDALLFTCYLLAAALAAMLGRAASIRHDESILHALAWTFALTASASCAIAIAQWFDVIDSLMVLISGAGQRVTANLAQSNHLATLLMLGIASIFFLRQGNRISTWSSTPWLIFLLLGVILTQSRTAWLCFLAFAVWWFVKMGRRSVISPASVAGLFLFLMAGSIWVSDLAVFLRLIEPGHELDFMERASAMQRMALWGQAWHAISESPQLGYGAGQVAVAQVESSIAYPVQMLSLHTHNIVLDILLWFGPAIGSVVIAFWFWRLITLAVKATSLGAVYLMMCVGAITLHGMLEYPLEYAYFLFPLFFILGILEEQHGVWALSLPRYSTAAAWCIALFLMSSVWREYRLMEDDHRMLRFELARIGSSNAPGAIPEVHLLTQLAEMNSLARAVPRSDIPEVQMDGMRKVAFRYPYIPSLYRYAQALALNGRVDDSVDVLRRLRSIYGPRSFEEVKVTLQNAQRNEPGYAELNRRLEGLN